MKLKQKKERTLELCKILDFLNVLLERKWCNHEYHEDFGHCLLFVWCFEIFLTLGILTSKMEFMVKKDSLETPQTPQATEQPYVTDPLYPTTTSLSFQLLPQLLAATVPIFMLPFLYFSCAGNAISLYSPDSPPLWIRLEAQDF